MDMALANYLQQLNSDIQGRLDAQKRKEEEDRQEWLAERQIDFNRVLGFIPEPLRPYCSVNEERYGNHYDCPVKIELPEHKTVYADSYIARYEDQERLRLKGPSYHDRADTDIASVIAQAKRDWEDERDAQRREEERSTAEATPREPTPIERMRTAIAANSYEEVRLWADVVRAEALHELAERGSSF